MVTKRGIWEMVLIHTPQPPHPKLNQAIFPLLPPFAMSQPFFRFLGLGFQLPCINLTILFMAYRQPKRLKDWRSFLEHHRLDLSDASFKLLDPQQTLVALPLKD